MDFPLFHAPRRGIQLEGKTWRRSLPICNLSWRMWGVWWWGRVCSCASSKPLSKQAEVSPRCVNTRKFAIGRVLHPVGQLPPGDNGGKLLPSGAWDPMGRVKTWLRLQGNRWLSTTISSSRGVSFWAEKIQILSISTWRYEEFIF